MSVVLLLWLLTAPERVVIMDETVSIPAGRSGVVELGLKQRVGTVEQPPQWLVSAAVLISHPFVAFESQSV